MGMLVVPDVEAVDERGHALERPAHAHADGHGEEDPAGEVAVEERESLRALGHHGFSLGLGRG